LLATIATVGGARVGARLAGLAPTLLVALAVAHPAALRAQRLTFDGLQDFESVNQYYNGGHGSQFSGPGPAFGITLGSAAWAIVDFDDGGTGNFENNPSGHTVLEVGTFGSPFMNVAPGFTSGIALYYSAINYPGQVRVYSGPDGTGTLLQSLDLRTLGNGCGVPPGREGGFNCWERVQARFDGVARSVDFGGATAVFIDDVTLGTQTVPEPGSGLLVGAGLAFAAAAGALRGLPNRAPPLRGCASGARG
jgi:hypothetical protein